MGNTDGKSPAAGGEAQVYEMLADSRGGGQKALCGMAEDLMFFSELIGLLRCMVRLLQTGVSLPEEADGMTGWIYDEEVRVLEKWALFMDLM